MAEIGQDAQVHDRNLRNVHDTFNTTDDPMTTIRPERPEDAAAIGPLITAAFLTAEHRDGTEAAIVDRLRADGALLLSLVAADGPALVGHVAASPVTVGGRPGWAGIGPLAVRADRRRQGIGARLMTAALDALRARGLAGAVLVGDPAYYARFGFAARPGLTVPGIPDAYVLALPFAGPAPAGAIAYHPAFSLA
jgi:putative acetyltransferase